LSLALPLLLTFTHSITDINALSNALPLIIIITFYSNKDIFLRELISNSSATEPTSSAHELLQSLYLIGSVTFAHRLDLVVDRGAGIFSVIFSVVPLPVPVPVPAPLGQSSPSPSPSPSHNSLYTDLTAHHHHHHYHYHYN
jgi:hypothetical protein